MRIGCGVAVVVTLCACGKKAKTYDWVEVAQHEDAHWSVKVIDGTVPIEPNRDMLADKFPALEKELDEAAGVHSRDTANRSFAAYIDPRRGDLVVNYEFTAAPNVCAKLAIADATLERKSKADTFDNVALGDKEWVRWTKTRDDTPRFVSYEYCEKDKNWGVTVQIPPKRSAAEIMSALEAALAVATLK